MNEKYEMIIMSFLLVNLYNVCFQERHSDILSES